ncbi:MAG: SEC-C domain-containing protein [Spirochaetaceae bacterium]|nr:SEC-C domain-containing protein [Spirochaetaceae bacterium]HPG25176.1 SEC-C metal-binding domain-containing protein [Myxococcota bacterium]
MSKRATPHPSAHVHGPGCDHDHDHHHDHGHAHGGPAPYVRSEPKIQRNDPCPCGSGKKYKKCHAPNG